MLISRVLQVPARDFFVKTLFLFDGGEDVGMVLSPQVTPVPCLSVLQAKVWCR